MTVFSFTQVVVKCLSDSIVEGFKIIEEEE